MMKVSTLVLVNAGGVPSSTLRRVMRYILLNKNTILLSDRSCIRAMEDRCACSSRSVANIRGGGVRRCTTAVMHALLGRYDTRARATGVIQSVVVLSARRRGDVPENPTFTTGTKKSGGPKTSALTCRLLLFDQATEKMPRPPFAPIPTSVFCTLV